MKKIVTITAIAIALLSVGMYVTYTIMSNVASYNKNQDQVTNGQSVVSSAANEGTKAEIKEQTEKIGGVNFDTKLTETSTEYEVIDVMHKMTHQKVRSSNKWGSIPMTEGTINQIFDIVSKSDFDHKGQLIAIIDKWKIGNFVNVDSDHNYFWNLQDGTIGEAYGTLSPDEEAEFIKNNFSQKVKQ